ncbi:MAG: class I SAM-dependent methyltransferase [Magnetococcales bacterium]|nr:class I SAM-dependent methyltransferase [Magnetococcales bacterium]
MDEQTRKKMITSSFNAASKGYDKPALRFFKVSAKLHSQQMALQGDENVLDIATGTGALALEITQQLPNGRVTGVDLSDGMLEQAQKKAIEMGLGNTTFSKMDMTALDFPDENFDAISCSFGIFFVEDMVGLLKHFSNKVKIGGGITISSFGTNLFHPMADLFYQRIETYGVEIPPKSWKRVDDEEKLAALFAAAGLKEFRVKRHNIGYPLDDIEMWWDIVWFAGFRGLLNQLDDISLQQFRKEHLDEVSALEDRDGLIHLPIETLYASGVKLQ